MKTHIYKRFKHKNTQNQAIHQAFLDFLNEYSNQKLIKDKQALKELIQHFMDIRIATSPYTFTDTLKLFATEELVGQIYKHKDIDAIREVIHNIVVNLFTKEIQKNHEYKHKF